MGLLCRVCANQHDYLIPIFEGEGLDHDMPTKIDKHLPIKVRDTDRLPTQICYQCASTVIAYSDLVVNCIDANKKLNKMLKDMKLEEVKDDVSTAGEEAYDDNIYDDDTGGAGDVASEEEEEEEEDEDFEKEIKQLISDAGVELPSSSSGGGSATAAASGASTRSSRKKSAVAATTVASSSRKRKSETAVSRKSDNKKSKSDSSKTSLVKPKEEPNLTSSDDR